MSDCNKHVDKFSREDGGLSVIEKYEGLMLSTLSEDSLYARSKETFFAVFDKLNVTDSEKASMVSHNIMQLTTQLSASAMQSAVMWAKEERDGQYQLALIKAQTDVAYAQAAKTQEEICIVDKDIELKCAQIEAAIAGSIRDNGKVTSYVQDADGDTCRPKTLESAGLKYAQTKQVEADSYRLFADAYRKSGVVVIGEDSNDSVRKGLSGDADGYTWQQKQNAERQRIAYEDSKLNHAVNSSASMIGQMLSAEVAPDPDTLGNWRNAMTRLLVPHSTTSGG